MMFGVGIVYASLYVFYYYIVIYIKGFACFKFLYPCFFFVGATESYGVGTAIPWFDTYEWGTFLGWRPKAY